MPHWVVMLAVALVTFAVFVRLMESRLAFDWYFSGHNFKWMTDAGLLTSTAADTNDVQVRSQLQLVF